jgi:hypothetical protein
MQMMMVQPRMASFHSTHTILRLSQAMILEKADS